MKNILKMFKKPKSNTSLEEVLQIFNENKNTPAYPQNLNFKDCEIDFYGLTKREYFAGLAMQGIMASLTEMQARVGSTLHYAGLDETLAREAVSISDALLKELDKK